MQCTSFLIGLLLENAVYFIFEDSTDVRNASTLSDITVANATLPSGSMT